MSDLCITENQNVSFPNKVSSSCQLGRVSRASGLCRKNCSDSITLAIGIVQSYRNDKILPKVIWRKHSGSKQKWKNYLISQTVKDNYKKPQGD